MNGGELRPARAHDPLEAQDPPGAAQAMARARSALVLPDIASKEEMPVHTLPETRRQRVGSFGISASLHVLTLIALLLQSQWGPRPSEPEATPLTVALQQTLTEPASTPSQFIPPPTPPRTEVPSPRPAPPDPLPPRALEPVQPERKPVPPPPIPKEVPPPVPLPAPKRMGEQVPIPHFPVPGTVPPEESKSGKPGPPGPPASKPLREQGGDEQGMNDADTGAGSDAGVGSGREARSVAERGTGQVRGSKAGSISVPRLRGRPTEEDGSGRGGRRRGLNLSLPPDSGAFGEFSFDDKDYDWSDFWPQMYWAIWRSWMNRLWVSTSNFERWALSSRASSLRGVVVVHYVIERSGAVTSIEVIEPSIMPPLDASARDALKEVILPRLPEDYPKDRTGVTATFHLEAPDTFSLKENLKYKKYGGSF